MRPFEPMSLTIEALSHEGRGLARVGGKVGFVPGALPGETVSAVLVRRHARYDDYRLVEVLEPAADRVTAPCPLVGRCGGCDLQHLAGEAQLRHKTAAVLDLLERQAGLSPERLEGPLRSEPFGYRHRARLAFRATRRGPAALGFRELGGNSVVAVAECPVLAPVLAALPGRLQVLADSLHRASAIGHFELLVSEDGAGAQRPVIHLHAGSALSEPDLAAIGELAAAVGAYLTLRVRESPVEYLHHPVPEAPGYLLPEFALRLAFEPGAFFQGNFPVNRQLVGRAVAWVKPWAKGTVLDAFCGLGNFSLALARSGLHVLGIDASPLLVQRARDNAHANGVTQARFAVRDLSAQAPLPFPEPGAAILDPPRAGAPALARALQQSPVPAVLYVSCSPPTLARDAAVLAAGGFRLHRLALADMFPQTGHIEALALFVR